MTDFSGIKIMKQCDLNESLDEFILENDFSEYELYQLLEANGYKTTEKNKNILKEGLVSGKYVIVDKSFDVLDEARGYIKRGRTGTLTNRVIRNSRYENEKPDSIDHPANYHSTTKAIERGDDTYKNTRRTLDGYRLKEYGGKQVIADDKKFNSEASSHYRSAGYDSGRKAAVLMARGEYGEAMDTINQGTKEKEFAKRMEKIHEK